MPHGKGATQVLRISPSAYKSLKEEKSTSMCSQMYVSVYMQQLSRLPQICHSDCVLNENMRPRM